MGLRLPKEERHIASQDTADDGNKNIACAVDFLAVCGRLQWEGLAYCAKMTRVSGGTLRAASPTGGRNVRANKVRPYCAQNDKSFHESYIKIN
jgi:hypothetical protein